MIGKRKLAVGRQTIAFELLAPATSKRGKQVLWSFPVLVGSERRTQEVMVPVSMGLDVDEVADLAAKAVGDEICEKVRASCSHIWAASRRPKCRLCGVPRVFIEPVFKQRSGLRRWPRVKT